MLQDVGIDVYVTIIHFGVVVDQDFISYQTFKTVMVHTLLAITVFLYKTMAIFFLNYDFFSKSSDNPFLFLHSDVNECELFSVCDVNARCINTMGSYQCLCNSGFQGNGFICKGMVIYTCLCCIWLVILFLFIYFFMSLICTKFQILMNVILGYITVTKMLFVTTHMVALTAHARIPCLAMAHFAKV